MTVAALHSEKSTINVFHKSQTVGMFPCLCQQSSWRISPNFIAEFWSGLFLLTDWKPLMMAFNLTHLHSGWHRNTSGCI